MVFPSDNEGPFPPPLSLPPPNTHVTDVVVQGLSIMVFISDNEASQHAVNLAVALARKEVDSVHVMHACTNEGSTPDAQKLMARCTQGLGSSVNSEVMVRRCPPFPSPSIPTPTLLTTPTPQAYCTPLLEARTGTFGGMYTLLLSSYGRLFCHVK